MQEILRRHPDILTLNIYKYLVLGREGPYFVREHADSKSKYTKKTSSICSSF